MKKREKIAIGVILVLIIALALALFMLFSKDKTYTVTFDSNGGSEIAPITLNKNSQLILPENPVKEGYDFVQWELDGVKVTNGYVVTKDVTLTAVYKEAEVLIEYVTVTFDSDGGSTVDKVTLEKGSQLTLPANPTREGYSFDKWVDESGNTVETGIVVENDMTIKAVWIKKQPSAPSTPSTPSTVAVSSISLNKSSLDLIIGNSSSLSATISPSNATDKSVKWSSSDSSVITVDSKGNLKAVGIGTATITATSSNGKKATATVSSNVESITLTITNSDISKYNGATNSTTVKVTTSPSVDAKYITVSYPDATGPNAVAYGTNNGDGTYTFTARDNWSSVPVNINVTATVGNKSGSTSFNVEPELKLTYVGANVNGNSLTVVSGNSFDIIGNLQIKCRVNSKFVSSINYYSSEKKFTVSVINEGSHPDGFQMDIRTNAGQQKIVSVTVNLQ